MADYKEAYSKISKYYIENDVIANEIDKARYERSKLREMENNEIWKKNKVNLNEIVDKFVTTVEGFVEEYTEGGVKYDFEGPKYIVKCDKVAGYLRIYDKEAKMYCRLDGTPSRNGDETHFKIKRREEM